MQYTLSPLQLNIACPIYSCIQVSQNPSKNVLHTNGEALVMCAKTLKAVDVGLMGHILSITAIHFSFSWYFICLLLRALVEWCCQGRTKVLSGKPISVHLDQPQI
jgi:hypothetical protein